MPEKHALLSASGAHKWIPCTPSARLEETLPETQSDYAEEGRLAHAIGELKLRKAFVEPMGARTFNARLKKLQEQTFTVGENAGKTIYQEEMLKYTDVYLDYISKIVHGFPFPPYVAIEKQLNYSAYAPEGFGTGDCIVIGGDTLHVIDLKYGKGVPVSAVWNQQMMLYALGAVLEYSILFPIQTVKVAIIQPRLDSINEWQIAITELLAWGESIKPIAQLAFAGQGEFTPGEHCRFCRAKATCRARMDNQLSLEGFKKMLPPLISNDEVGQALTRGAELVSWYKALEEYALGAVLQGQEVPGWKAVAGRSVRQFTDTDVAFKRLTENGIEETMLYERKPLTLAGVETLIGKPKFKDLLSEFVITPPGKPTLVPLSDKREAITTRSSAEEDFGTPMDQAVNE